MPEQIQDPINAFPLYVQEIINHYSESKGYPHEYFVTAMLSAISTSMGRSVTLTTGNYTAIGSIWAIILGKRGFTKSEPLDDAFKPVREFQFAILAQHRSELDELEEYKANNPKAKTKEIPAPKKVILSDSTPEALVLTLAENQKGCGIVYDELAGFIGRFNRYNSGADEQMYLSMFNGGSIMRERVNAKSNAYAKTSYLTISGTTQPSVLKAVFHDKVESGFFDRWLISNPDNVKKQYPNIAGIDPVFEGEYSAIMNNLLILGYDENSKNQMCYTPESYAVINSYQRKMIDTENETTDDNERGILAKMEIYLHRFALILQMLEYGISGDISDVYHVKPECAQGAVILCEYFIKEAKRVRILSPVESLKAPWDEIWRQMPENGKTFGRNDFVLKCAQFEMGERIADKFLKENSDRSEAKLFFKVKHGQYTKNLF